MAVATSQQRAAQLSLDDLPPALQAHLEFCRSKGLDLLPSIDPHHEPPAAPIIAELEAWRESRRDALRSPQTADNQYNIVRSLVVDFDLLEGGELVPSLVNLWLWRHHSENGLEVVTLRGYLKAIQAFARYIGGQPAVDRLKAVRVAGNAEGFRRTHPVALERQVLEELSRGRPRGEVASKFDLAPDVIDRIARYQLTRFFCTETPVWRRRCQSRKWFWMDRYDAFGEPTYRDLDAVLDEHNRRSDSERRLIDPRNPAPLPDSTPEERKRSKWLISRGIQVVRRIEDQALLVDERQGGAVGSRELLLVAAVRLWHEAEGTATYRSPAKILDRLNGLSGRIRVALGGWSSRWKSDPRKGAYRYIQGLLRRRDGGQSVGRDRRGEVLLEWEGSEGLDSREGLGRWNGMPLQSREAESPGNPRKIKSEKEAAWLKSQARKRRGANGGGKKARQTEHAEDRQNWPCEAWEEHCRRLRDKDRYDDGLSYGNIGRRLNIAAVQVWEAVWRARIENDPDAALDAIGRVLRFRLARRATELHDEPNTVSRVGEILQHETGETGTRSDKAVYRLIRTGRTVRAWERRAQELLQNRPSGDDGQHGESATESPTGETSTDAQPGGAAPESQAADPRPDAARTSEADAAPWDPEPSLVIEPGGIRCCGAKQALAGKPLQVLRCFAGSPDGAVSAEQLRDEVWDGRLVTDQTVRTGVGKARAAVSAVLRKAGIPKRDRPEDPIPCLDQGRNLAWRLTLRRDANSTQIRR